ncbi:hypothetical protein BD410DRAFT_843489 [Rickenella mellea]|uniref:Uncharacterized protein n=1 Tax=Rickenella mellea TaxID=50990 RepID=A0A4Y7PSS4_9AGAM|nr:hypothetical protein BD410DRAFT_843489 [Rickenella mellea]
MNKDLPRLVRCFPAEAPLGAIDVRATVGRCHHLDELSLHSDEPLRKEMAAKLMMGDELGAQSDQVGKDEEPESASDKEISRDSSGVFSRVATTTLRLPGSMSGWWLIFETLQVQYGKIKGGLECLYLPFIIIINIVFEPDAPSYMLPQAPRQCR